MPDTPPTDAMTCPPGATPDLGAWITVASFDLAHSLCAPHPPTVPDDAGLDCYTAHDPTRCYAETYDRATGEHARCHLPGGHDGYHEGACLQWTTVADFWAAVRQPTETP